MSLEVNNVLLTSLLEKAIQEVTKPSKHMIINDHMQQYILITINDQFATVYLDYN